MLHFHNVSVQLGGQHILNSIRFSLPTGKLSVLVGENGSGKSTLLSCVNQQLRYGGTISLDDVDISRLSPTERAKEIAYLPQKLPFPHITTEELVSFGRNPYLDFTGRLTDTDRERISAALIDADATQLSGRYVDTLSGGEQQRVALAMILAQNTPILLLDEPTSHMDQRHQDAFLEQLSKLKGNKTILVVLHDMTTAVAYADHMIVLNDGALIFDGSKDECLQHEIIENTFRLKRYTFEDGKIFFASK